MSEKILEIKDLFINFYTYRGIVKALNGINLIINKAESIGLVGESGCGKSVTAKSIINLVDYPGKSKRGRFFLKATIF